MSILIFNRFLVITHVFYLQFSALNHFLFFISLILCIWVLLFPLQILPGVIRLKYRVNGDMRGMDISENSWLDGCFLWFFLLKSYISRKIEKQVLAKKLDWIEMYEFCLESFKWLILADFLKDDRNEIVFLGLCENCANKVLVALSCSAHSLSCSERDLGTLRQRG